MSFSISRSSQASIRSNHKITSSDPIKSQSYKLRAKRSPKAKFRHAIFFGVHRVPKTHVFLLFFKRFLSFLPLFCPQDQIWFFCPVFNSVFEIFFVLHLFFRGQFYKNLCKNCKKTHFSPFIHSFFHFPYFAICILTIVFSKATIRHHFISLDIILKKQKPVN